MSEVDSKVAPRTRVGVVMGVPGFFVSGHAPPLALSDLGPKLDRDIDPLWLTRQSLETGEQALRPGCGWLPPHWLPEGNMRRALRSVARDTQSSLVEYATPAGSPALRQHLAWRLAQQGIHVEPGQVVLTDGGTHALDMVCRFLLEPGDTVLLARDFTSVIRRFTTRPGPH